MLSFTFLIYSLHTLTFHKTCLFLCAFHFLFFSKKRGVFFFFHQVDGRLFSHPVPTVFLGAQCAQTDLWLSSVLCIHRNDFRHALFLLPRHLQELAIRGIFLDDDQQSRHSARHGSLHSGYFWNRHKVSQFNC